MSDPQSDELVDAPTSAYADLGDEDDDGDDGGGDGGDWPEDPWELRRWVFGNLLSLGMAIATCFLADTDNAVSYLLFTFVEGYKMFWAFWLGLCCVGPATKCGSILISMSEMAGNTVGCGLFCYYANTKANGGSPPTAYAVYAILTALMLFTSMWEIKSAIKYPEKPSEVTCKSLMSSGCAAFLGACNGFLGVTYGLFYFLIVLLAGKGGGYFGNAGPALVVNIHIWITCTYNDAKLANMIPTKWLRDKAAWWFPAFDDVQAFDIAAYKKWEIINFAEMMVYAVVIGGMCASQHGAAKNTDAENLGLLAGMGAGFAGTGFSLFCIFLCFTCVDRVKPGKLNDSVEKGFGEAAAGYGSVDDKDYVPPSAV